VKVIEAFFLCVAIAAAAQAAPDLRDANLRLSNLSERTETISYVGYEFWSEGPMRCRDRITLELAKEYQGKIEHLSGKGSLGFGVSRILDYDIQSPEVFNLDAKFFQGGLGGLRHFEIIDSRSANRFSVQRALYSPAGPSSRWQDILIVDYTDADNWEAERDCYSQESGKPPTVNLKVTYSKIHGQVKPRTVVPWKDAAL
jgi:hypothetical protein